MLRSVISIEKSNKRANLLQTKANENLTENEKNDYIRKAKISDKRLSEISMAYNSGLDVDGV